VANALLDAARERAASIAADAAARAHAVGAKARVDAEHVVDDARTEGERSAQKVAEQRLAVARDEAHAVVLAARRHAYEEVRAAALVELAACAGTPRADALRDRLEALVSSRLGDDVAVGSMPAEGIWASAEKTGRRCVVTAEALVDQVLASHADDVEGLWR